VEPSADAQNLAQHTVQEPAPPDIVGFQKRSFPMTRTPAITAIAILAVLMSPADLLAQSPGGGAGGTSAGSGSAAGSPSAGSAGAGTSGISGVPSGPANAGGLNNSGNDPSGVGNSSKLASPPPPGTNSAGTANSSGPGSGVTTGSAGRTKEDAAIDAEGKAVERKIKSICRGC
jgi:hypothetical protein